MKVTKQPKTPKAFKKSVEKEAPEMTVEQLKNTSLENLRLMADQLGVEWPKAKRPEIERMHLTRKLKEHFGLAKPKAHGGGRKPSTNTTLAIHEIHEIVARVEKTLSEIKELLS
jgi:hypothetical protein